MRTEESAATGAMGEALGRAGYRRLGAYFRSRARATFASMALELGVSGETVRRWYRSWAGSAA